MYLKIHSNYYKQLADGKLLAHGQSDSPYGLGTWLNLSPEDSAPLLAAIAKGEYKEVETFKRTSNGSRP